MDNEMRFAFPVAAGIQGGRTFYTACVPFNTLSRLLAIDTGNVLDRSQRAVDPKRAKAISKYICENTGSFVLPALTGVVEDETLAFTPASRGASVGELSLAMDASIKLFDGQHRATGIMDALAQKKQELRNQQVTIQLFVNMTLADRQQAFSDINSNAKAVSQSLNLAYNKRNHMAQSFSELIEMVDSWRDGIDFENNIIKPSSTKLFSFRHVVEANRLLLGLKAGEEPNERHLVQAAKWWNYVSGFAGWQLEDEVRSERRSSLVTLNAVGLMVLARIGHAVFTHKHEPASVARELSMQDWTRKGEFWHGNIVGHDGNLVTKASAHAAAAKSIIDKLKLIPELPPSIDTENMKIAHPNEIMAGAGVPCEFEVQREFKGWFLQSTGVWTLGLNGFEGGLIKLREHPSDRVLFYPILDAMFMQGKGFTPINLGSYKTWLEATEAVAKYQSNQDGNAEKTTKIDHKWPVEITEAVEAALDLCPCEPSDDFYSELCEQANQLRLSGKTNVETVLTIGDLLKERSNADSKNQETAECVD